MVLTGKTIQLEFKEAKLHMKNFNTLKILLIPFLSLLMASLVYAENPTHALLQKYCFNCHDEDVQKGNFQLDNLNLDISSGKDAESWQLILDQLNLDEMPPRKKKQPSSEERRQIINYLTESLKIAAEQKRKDVQVVMRRLTKKQYSNSLRDLLGIDITYGKALPKEYLSKDGFKNNGSEQVISLLQTEYYQSIADSALEKATPEKPEPSLKYHMQFGFDINSKKSKKDKPAKKRNIPAKINNLNNADYLVETLQNRNIASKASKYEKVELEDDCKASMRGSKKGSFEFLKEGIKLKPNVPHTETYEAHAAFLPPSPNLQMHLKEFPLSGEFLLKIKVAKGNKKSGDAYVKAYIGEKTDWGVDFEMFEHAQKITKPAGKFQTIEFKGRLENFPIPVIDPRHIDPKSALVIGVVNDSPKGANEAQIIISSMELIINPVESWPPHSYSKIFIPSKNTGNEDLYSKEIIKNFMSRAFRRPVSSHEVKSYHGLWKTFRPQSRSFVESIRGTLSAILSSPNFLYLIEKKPQEGSFEISEMEMASRLSYFLWNSMPDTELLRLAFKKQLKQNLDFQIDRMLNNPKSQGFIEAFTSEWLQIEKMVNVELNPKKYKNYNRFTRKDMVFETRHFFKEVLDKNLSVMNFIDSDFTMLNQNLAQFYGIKGVSGSAFRRVLLKRNPERRGLISQGLFLSGNSDGTEGHPVKRGVWLISRILDDPPPEPPPNVPEIDNSDPEMAKLPMRQQLEKHRESQSCYECHRKIDPWGMLFDNYDAAGQWMGKKLEPIELSNGKSLRDSNELKQYLLKERKEQVARAMTKYLLRYGLGRSLSFVDEKYIDQIVNESQKNDHKLKSLIFTIVKNPIFSKK